MTDLGPPVTQQDCMTLRGGSGGNLRWTDDELDFISNGDVEICEKQRNAEDAREETAGGRQLRHEELGRLRNSSWLARIKFGARKP